MSTHVKRICKGFHIFIIGSAAGMLMAADVSFMGVVKGVAHWQTGPTTVALESNPFQFNAFLDPSAPGRVLSASVTVAGRTATPLGSDGDSWDLFSGFSSQAALEAAYPNGNFTLSIIGQNDGARSVVVLLAGDAYPAIPTLNGFNALQSVAAGSPLTLSWQPFTGGTATDFVQLEIRTSGGQSDETVFETAGPGEPGSLNGTHTSVTVPAGALTAGRSYSGRLLFARILELDTSYGQGVSAIAGYYRETGFPLVTASSTDTEAPQFWNSTPQAQDGPVSRNSGVAFEFSEPMQASQGIAWTGVDPSKFTYRWNADGRVLFCLYAGQLPANAQVGWQLNSSAFRDVAGNALPYSPQGGFSTEATDTTGTPDLKVAGLWKSQIFAQNPGGAPQILAAEGYGAGAFAESNGYNTLLGGSLRTPDGRIIPLEYDQGDALEAEIEVNSKAEQDAVAPAGTYQLNLETAHQGTKTAALTVPPDAYPSVPEFLNLAATQGFDPAQPLTLTWKPMAGDTVNDFIGLWIEPEHGGDSVFETPDFLSGQSLNGAATSVTVPAGTMRAGRSYRMELEFAHPAAFDVTTLPGSVLVVAYTRLTQATLIAAGTVAPPVLQLAQEPGSSRWRVRVTGESGINYVLEAATQLDGPWAPLVNFQIFGDAHEFYDGVLNPRRFYRVREGF